MIDSPLVIWLPLLPPSINHLYRPGPRRGQRVLSDEARAFRAYVVSEVALQARHEGWSVPDGDLWITGHEWILTIASKRPWTRWRWRSRLTIAEWRGWSWSGSGSTQNVPLVRSPSRRDTWRNHDSDGWQSL